MSQCGFLPAFAAPPFPFGGRYESLDGMDVLRFVFKVVFWVLRGFWITAVWLRPYIFGNGRTNARTEGTHGTARFATRWELLTGGALTGKGPVVGKGPWGRLIRFTRDGLVMVFASTGAGKGLGIVVPTLLDYPGSILVTDPKGENYAITARRRRKFGRVLMLNPADVVQSERFNPLDMVRVGTPMEADDATALARLMIKPESHEAPHWNDKATSLLTALILHTLAGPEALRTLAHVRSLSVGGPLEFRDLLCEIRDTSRSVKATEIAGGFIGTIPAEPGGKAGEFESILSTLHKATEPWSRGSPAGILSSESTFALSDLTEDVCTLYLCVDEELLPVYDRWLRVMTGCALNAIMRSKYRPTGQHKVLLLLDEVAVLGPLDPLEKQSGLLRAYCTPVLIWQSLPQAAALYGRERANAFLANASCRVFFGVNDHETAEHVASLVGNTTTLSASENVSQSSEAWVRKNRQEGQSESGYWLLDPSEVQRLPVTRALIKFRDIPFVTLAVRLDYRKIWRWWGMWDSWRVTAPASKGTRRGPPSSPTGARPTTPSGPSLASGPAPRMALPAAFING